LVFLKISYIGIYRILSNIPENKKTYFEDFILIRGYIITQKS